MSMTRPHDFSLAIQGVQNLLTTNSINPKAVSGKKVTLVVGSDSLANSQFVNYLTESRAEASPATYARVVNLPNRDDAVLCECPALGAQGSSDAVNVAASLSAEVTVNQAGSIGGVVVVVPYEHLSTANDELFSDLMFKLSEFFGSIDFSKAENKLLLGGAMQLVVLANKSALKEVDVVNAYQNKLANLIRSSEDIKEIMSIMEPNADLEAMTWPMLDFLKAMEGWARPLFANLSVLASKNHRFKDASIHGHSCETMLELINVLSPCKASVFHFDVYNEARSSFQEKLMDAMNQCELRLTRSANDQNPIMLDAAEKLLMKSMAKFVSRLPVFKFAEMQPFLSAWQFQSNAAYSARLYRKATPLVTIAPDQSVVPTCKL